MIDENQWRDATRDYSFMQGLTAEEDRRLRYIASDFLARKAFVGGAGFVITERVKIEVAAQASVLVLALNVDYYEGWREIVIYPNEFRPRREVVDESGVVHVSEQVLAGEAWQSGPVVLSYEHVNQGGYARDGAGHNVVIHEFAHKLDMLTGEANGCPPLHMGMDRERWKRTFMEAYLRFCADVDAADVRAPYDGGKALDALLIDPYGAETPAEFFAVISETFFEAPEAVWEFSEPVYNELKAFYRQDPLARLVTAGVIERVES